jgi:hypothetical protein
MRYDQFELGELVCQRMPFMRLCYNEHNSSIMVFGLVLVVIIKLLYFHDILFIYLFS